MGAYLHLRSLAELGETSDSSINAGNLLLLSESACAANEVTPAGTPRSFTPISCTEERTDNTTVIEMDDCSNFWAGKIDDVFEDLPVKTRCQDASTARTELNGTGQEDFLKIPKDRWLDRREVADSSSGKSGMIQNAYMKDKILDEVRSVNHGYPSEGFEDGATVASTSSLPLDGDKGIAFIEGHDAGSTLSCRIFDGSMEDHSERLPDHLLIELLVRVPTRDWPAAACVKKRWAQLFKGDGLWHSALMKKWPGATYTKRWPGPIARGSSKRRYTALYVSDSLFAKDKVEGVNEVAGHVYLFLKEQLESPTPPVSYGLLHGTIIDQFLACCKTGDEAHKLASHIWIAVLDNLDESEDTFHLLMRIAEEWEVFPGYPYSKSHAVQWRLFERLFTDFRDCLSQYNYFDVLTRVRNKFEMIPQTWLGY